MENKNQLEENKIIIKKGAKFVATCVDFNHEEQGVCKIDGNLNDEEVIGLEIETGNPICYELDDNLKPILSTQVAPLPNLAFIDI